MQSRPSINKNGKIVTTKYKWMISIHDNEIKYQEIEILADNYATVSDLKACKSYTFLVSAVSPEEAQGSTETVKTVMEETEPTTVTSVKATALNASSVEVVWVPAIIEECVHHYLVCITHLTSLVQECHNDTDLQQTFTGLEACVDYEVTVTPVSPSGNLGSFTYDLSRTTDLRPGPPTNLKVTDTNAHSALVTFGPPLEHPLCVIQYDIEVEEMGSVKSIKTHSASVLLQQLLSGLNACSDHEVRISAVTPSGLESEKANVNFTTSEDTPSAPRALTHITVTVDQVELHWFAPLTNRLCVDMYKVSWTSGSDSGNTDYTPSGYPPEVKPKEPVGLVGKHCSASTLNMPENVVPADRLS
ncbi:Receptor-type tyrosine-protein phosphatase delta [Portunus trituberculatus]|uniref:Receptor-type tyrosine-protein phosphatase delta n=1 Tax=Portunus trituberculatus TaxID=210409 RepID=A0A5B7DDA9_PORTR|nr:Receptor-type tyrosine-protein phosphatase delta [Portunus trituberculatus]